jgi:hypothetical protein
MGEVRYFKQYLDGRSGLYFDGRAPDVAYGSILVLRVGDREERRVALGGNGQSMLVLAEPLDLSHWTLLELVAVEEPPPPREPTLEERRLAARDAFLRRG